MRAAFRQLSLTSRDVGTSGHFFNQGLVRVRCRGPACFSTHGSIYPTAFHCGKKKLASVADLSARMYCAATRAGTYFTLVARIAPAAIKDIADYPPNRAVGGATTESATR